MTSKSKALCKLPVLIILLAFINVVEMPIAHARCRNVAGTLKEKAGATPAVTTVGTLRGGLVGTYSFTITNTIPNSQIASVSLFNGSSTITTRKGDILYGIDAGAIDSTSPGNLVDLITITGGTSALRNASGQIRVQGNFDIAKGRGKSTYKGRICIP
jgi:hypothetical protein